MQGAFKFKFSWEGCMWVKTVVAPNVDRARKQLKEIHPGATKILVLGAHAVQA